MYELMPLLLFVVTLGLLMTGFPVAFALGGASILFAGIASALGYFDFSFFGAISERIFGIMSNQTLISVPIFIFMGVMLERSKIAEELLETMGLLFGKMPGGLGISICLVGALLAASTGIVGATVVTMGLISLPVMLRNNYHPSFSTGVIAASGTLGQIIPPSIILILLGDVIGTAYQQAQLSLGNYAPVAVSVGDLFLGALIPGILLVVVYIIYILIRTAISPEIAPPLASKELEQLTLWGLWKKSLLVMAPALLLILGVLGSILMGLATPTEAASVGSIGAIALALIKRQLSWKVMGDVLESVSKINAMVFVILIGSSMFSLVFRGLAGDEIIGQYLTNLPGGVVSAFFVVMLVIFVLGFFLDFFEITFVVVPIVGPILLAMGLDPIWLGVMIAVNLQTSFLTPPFGFALFYLRGVAPASVTTREIYKGVVPFIVLQLLVLVLLYFVPDLITWLPKAVYQN